MAASRRAKGLVIGGAVVVALLAALVVLAAGMLSDATSARPSPTPFVSGYLEAIADGDADAARAIDDGLVSRVEGERVDTETFRSDEALGAASERISDIRIEESTVFSRENGRVTASYELEGERSRLLVDVVWDAATDGWALEDGVFHGVEVAGGTSSVGDTLPFSLGGVPSSDPAAMSPGRTTYLAYPGVYDFELALSPGVLSDPAAVPARLRVTPGPDSDPDIVYVQLSRQPTAADLIATRENG